MADPTQMFMLRLPQSLYEWIRDRSLVEKRSMTAIAIEAIATYRISALSVDDDEGRAFEALAEAVQATPGDPRWNALLAVLPYMRATPVRISTSEGKSLQSVRGFMKPESLVVNDPKNELYEHSALERAGRRKP